MAPPGAHVLKVWFPAHSVIRWGLNSLEVKKKKKWHVTIKRNILIRAIIWVDIKGVTLASVNFPTLEQNKLEWNCTWALALECQARINDPITVGPMVRRSHPCENMELRKIFSPWWLRSKRGGERAGVLLHPTRTHLQWPASFHWASLPKSRLFLVVYNSILFSSLSVIHFFISL